MARTPPLAKDFFPWRLQALGGRALCCNSGRKALPSAVRGTAQVFDGPFPTAQRRGNTARWVLRRYHSASPTFLVKEFLQAHDKLASPQINRFALGHR